MVTDKVLRHMHRWRFPSLKKWWNKSKALSLKRLIW